MQRKLIEYWLFWDDMRLKAVAFHDSWANNDFNDPEGMEDNLSRYRDIIRYCEDRKFFVERLMRKSKPGYLNFISSFSKLAELEKIN